MLDWSSCSGGEWIDNGHGLLTCFFSKKAMALQTCGDNDNESWAFLYLLPQLYVVSLLQKIFKGEKFLPIHQLRLK